MEKVVAAKDYALAEAALASRRHVILEKPLGITIRAARRIIDTAVATRRVLAVADNADQAGDFAQHTDDLLACCLPVPYRAQKVYVG